MTSGASWSWIAETERTLKTGPDLKGVAKQCYKSIVHDQATLQSFPNTKRRSVRSWLFWPYIRSAWQPLRFILRSIITPWSIYLFYFSIPPFAGRHLTVIPSHGFNITQVTGHHSKHRRYNCTSHDFFCWFFLLPPPHSIQLRAQIKATATQTEGITAAVTTIPFMLPSTMAKGSGFQQGLGAYGIHLHNIYNCLFVCL